MSISRRGFFGMLGALAVSPALAPLVKLLPPAPEMYTTYLMGKDAWVIVDWDEFRGRPRIKKIDPYKIEMKYTSGPPPDSTMRLRLRSSLRRTYDTTNSA